MKTFVNREALYTHERHYYIRFFFLNDDIGFLQNFHVKSVGMGSLNRKARFLFFSPPSKDLIPTTRKEEHHLSRCQQQLPRIFQHLS